MTTTSQSRHQSLPTGVVALSPPLSRAAEESTPWPAGASARGTAGQGPTHDPFVDGIASAGDLMATPEGRAVMARYLDELVVNGYGRTMAPFINATRARLAEYAAGGPA